MWFMWFMWFNVAFCSCFFSGFSLTVTVLGIRYDSHNNVSLLTWRSLLLVDAFLPWLHCYSSVSLTSILGILCSSFAAHMTFSWPWCCQQQLQQQLQRVFIMPEKKRVDTYKSYHERFTLRLPPHPSGSLHRCPLPSLFLQTCQWNDGLQ